MNLRIFFAILMFSLSCMAQMTQSRVFVKSAINSWVSCDGTGSTTPSCSFTVPSNTYFVGTACLSGSASANSIPFAWVLSGGTPLYATVGATATSGGSGFSSCIRMELPAGSYSLASQANLPNSVGHATVYGIAYDIK